MTVDFLSRRTALVSVLALAATAPGLASADPPAPSLSPDDKALVDRAAAYLQGLTEMKGRFEQTDARGVVSGGDLYLQRPGRARFAYDPPSGVLVVTDGYNVLVTDPRLKTANRYPLGATPLALLLAKHVRLDQGVAVSAVDRIPGGYAITAHDARHPAAGQITLIFSDSPLQLHEWRMTDPQGRLTRIRLTAFEPTSGLDPALFVVPPPKPARAGGGAL